LVILSRKGYTYRLATSTGVVLQSAVHAERLRVYNERQPYRPKDDVASEVNDWGKPLEIDDREVGVDNRYENKRPVRIVGTKQSAKKGHNLRKRVKWLVEYDDKTTKWIDDSALKERNLVDEYNVRANEDDISRN
jgi:hypothetical protein